MCAEGAGGRCSPSRRLAQRSDVAGVLASIGGNHSNQILPHLDFDLIAGHPKIVQGYSDMTVVLWP